MKKLPFILVSAILVLVSACGMDDESTWEEYNEWREANEAWFLEQQNLTNPDGSLYYEALYPEWDKSQYILIHYFNDRELTKNNLSPLYTSTVDMKYIGRLYNDEPFDSSYNNTTYGDSIYRTKCNAVISGWNVALEDMHVGDSCEIIIPYNLAYGAAEAGDVIKPYSVLRFNMKLVDIPYYEIKGE